MSNGYTSNLLCHFVGRSKKTDEERFDLLTLIINDGRLIANVRSPENLSTTFQSGSSCERAGEVFEKCDCVCFCDIPNNSLNIHTSKYSRFGMGFDKQFIASQGAHPVLYIPQNYSIVQRGDENEQTGQTLLSREPQRYFPDLVALTYNYVGIVDLILPLLDKDCVKARCKENNFPRLFNQGIWDAFMSGNDSIIGFDILSAVSNLASFIKLYDSTLPDEHPENYYMEREWRCLKNVCFTLNDIKTIYLPSEDYKTRFADAFPTYTGEYYIFDR